jgi:hypothetical protein
MKRRKKLSYKKHRKMYKKHANKTHHRNVASNPMRGGIRF